MYQESETIDIYWSVIEEQIVKWSSLLRVGMAKGKTPRLDISIISLADDSDPARKDDKRGDISVAKTSLSELDAQIDIEQCSGQSSVWWEV